ncbi:MAG: ATP-binding cassette domain-containing protein [Flavobacteriaceae bacterium]|nr:ATP-binding cassette domain-containing protein [Flavobacteriaceae bacterium]
MKSTYFRILSYARTGRWLVVSYSLCTLLSIVFGLMNITLLVPLLDVIFSKTEVLEIAKPEFSFSFQYLNKFFNWQFNEILREYGSLGTLYFVCGLVLASVILANFFRYLSQRIMIRVRVGVIKNLRKDFFEKIISLDLGFFSNQRKGDLISGMSNDLQSIEESVVATLQVFFKDPLIVMFYFGLLFYWSVQLTLFTLIVLPITGIIIGQISKRLKKDSGESQQLLGNLMSIAEEAISGIRIIKAFNAQKYTSGRFEEQNEAYRKKLKGMVYKREVASPLTEFVAYSVIVGIILYVGPQLLNHETDMTAQKFIAYLVVYVNILAPAKSISNSYTSIQRGLASGERIFKVLDEPAIIHEKVDATVIHDFEKEIEFKSLSFAYSRGDTGWVLKDINLTIPKGKMVALVGHSGSGKTTLSDMLPRYFDPGEGQVLIDGMNIKDLSLHSLRGLMGVVSQESILFNDTIFNNIAFGLTNATQELVEAAARIANAHHFILETSDGYQTKIGDRGSKLSGGQRQRISIARAVLKNPPILILDEATSALDAESEKVVQDALYKLMKNRTSIVIAHRLSTVQNADLIVVLDKGNIVQKGTHEQLLLQEGIYRQLNDLQKLS